MHEFIETAGGNKNEIMNVGEQEHRGVEFNVIRYGAKGGTVSSPMGKTTRS